MLYGCNTDPLLKEYPEKLSVQVNNANGPDRFDEIIVLQIEDIIAKYPNFNPMAFIIMDDHKELVSQINDLDADHQADQIVFMCDLSAGQSKNVNIHYSMEDAKPREYTKRTQAEISHKIGGKFVKNVYQGGTFQNVEYLEVPPEHTDNSRFIRYDGPGWESEKVGYRFYLDWRNATDIFGKKTHEMVLQNLGQDGFDSYHEMSKWGMDILKVGDSFGIGSWGMWSDGKANRVAQTDKVECAIKVNGPIQSMIETNYYGWKISGKKYDLNSTLTINAGSRLTHCILEISGDPENLCTGIVKHDSTNIHKSSDKNEGWQYFATYGKQSLANDMLGMVIFYKRSDLIESNEDDLSHIMILKPNNGMLDYFFAAVWEKELNGITTESQFIEYLNEIIRKLDSPVSIAFK
ncbi:MAG: DUF4861 domain-containing protein [Calditrichaceae bacterium]